ncbi:polysaccharide biosynthesis C-terminal domain-containing protein [candidate division KSB1 bacterium]|nr:polysaccharide biosynthesis C-terminal domain-containing protein [candidate division KSB1 bacterium]
MNTTQSNITNQLKRTARDSLIYLPAKVAPAIIGILLIRVLTSLFTKEEYGYYQIALSTFGLIRVAGVIWLSTSVTRFYLHFKNQNQERQFFSTLFVSALAGALLVAILSFLINFFIFKSRIEPILFSLVNLVIAASVFNAFFEIFIVVFRAGLEARKYSTFWLLFTAGKPLLGVGLILFFGYRVSGIFWAFLIVPLLLDIITFIRLDLIHLVRPSAVSVPLFKQFAKFGIPISFSFFSFWLLSLSDRYLIEIYRNTAEVGLYSVGYTISEKTLNFAYMVLMLAAYPIIVENWENHGNEQTQALITELTRYFMFLCMPILVVLVVIPEQILLLFSDKKFIEGAGVLPFIAIGVFISGLTQYVIKGWELHQKSVKIATLALTAGLTDILLNLILIPRFGFIGAGISACCAYSVYFLATVFFVRKEMAWHPPYRAIATNLAAAIVFGLFLSGMAIVVQNVLITAFMIVPFGVILYFLILILLKEITRDEIRKGWRLMTGLLKG